MTLFVVLAVVVVVVLAAAAWWVVGPTEPVHHDETRRAGDTEQVDVRDATLRGGGKSAWMRMGGGGF